MIEKPLILSGTFENGYGVTISFNQSYYHLVVVNDCILIHGKEYKKEDCEFQNKKQLAVSMILCYTTSIS